MKEKFKNFKKFWYKPFLCLVLPIFFLIFLLKLGLFSEIKTENRPFLKLFNKNQSQFFIVPKEKIESPNLTLIQKNSLFAIVPPVIVTPQILGQIIGQSEPEPRKEIIEYITQDGDTFSSIAENFNISLNTLLWANDLSKSSILKPSQKLIILPVSGILYQIKKDDTLNEIAKTYKGKVEEIISFNELSNEKDIYVGDFLIIPNGVLPPPVPKKPQITDNVVDSSSSSSEEIPLASSYFIYPTVSHYISQGLHWYNAVDFDGDCGDPIYAAAQGTVLRVKYGWNYGGGNYLTILHPNGLITYYGHLQKILVKNGENVSQGQIIALMGGKPDTPGAGRSTGCHLHFGVKGAKNPFSK